VLAYTSSGKRAPAETRGPEEEGPPQMLPGADDAGTQEEDAAELRRVQRPRRDRGAGQDRRRGDAWIGKLPRQLEHRKAPRVALQLGRMRRGIVRDQVVADPRVVPWHIPLALRRIRGQPVQQPGTGVEIHAAILSGAFFERDDGAIFPVRGSSEPPHSADTSRVGQLARDGGWSAHEADRAVGSRRDVPGRRDQTSCRTPRPPPGPAVRSCATRSWVCARTTTRSRSG
jgi:hypothetical protein